MSAANDFQPLSLCVLTVSDTRTAENDSSGDYLAAALAGAGHQLHERAIVRDDKYALRALVSRWIADEAVHGILVTGGTGFTGRDSTPEALLPLLADGGRILNVSTGLARFALPGYAAYASMKGGVEVLTRYLAKELGPRGIAVNVLAPGAIATDFGGGQVRDDAGTNAFIASQTALGRVGLPDDIGRAVALLLSDDAGWITAQRIEASGGMFL